MLVMYVYVKFIYKKKSEKTKKLLKIELTENNEHVDNNSLHE